MPVAKSEVTLNKQPEWNLFLHVLQRFFGKASSVTLMILIEKKKESCIRRDNRV